MRDPFPIPPISALSRAVQPWADKLSLTTLPLHIHEVILTALMYQFVKAVVSPWASNALFPDQYSRLSRIKKLNWDVHVVSLFQSTLINSLALWVMFADEERKSMDSMERVYGYTGAAAMIQAFAAGYFVWDLIITASHPSIFGLGMLAHAVGALAVYSFGFRPFVNYYSTVFILWELSSPFLNIHWFCDKLDMTGSKTQLYNGIILISMFFSCRLVWGTYQSFQVARDVWKALYNKPTYMAATPLELAQNLTIPVRYESTMQFVTEATSVPAWLAGVYLGANLTLNSLNFYWFTKMIEAIRKRFTTKEEPAEEIKTEQDGAVATGTDDTKHDIKQRIGRPRRRSMLDGEDQGDEPPPGI